MLEESQIIDKITEGTETLSYAEMETVSYSTRLRDVYNDRWWKPDTNAYFVHVDKGRVPNKKGSQLFIQYGQRSDDFLVDNYSFCLDPGANPFSSWKFRVTSGSKVVIESDDVTQMIPK